MRTRIAALAVVALVAAAPSAGAQQWYQLCTGTGPSSCAAVHVSLTALGPSSTRVAVRAQNLQGTFGGSTGASVLDRLFLNFSGAPTADGLTDAPLAGPGVASYLGTGNLAGATVGPWSYVADGATVSLFADNPGLGYFTDLLGCGTPSPLEDPGFRTCGRRGTRWVELAFDLSGTLTEADLQSVGFGTSYGDLGLGQHVCNDGPNPTVACDVERFTPTSTIPEPTTVALLGAGVAALGALARRRRTA